MTAQAPAVGAYQRAIDGHLRADARFGFKLAYLRSFAAPKVASAVARHGRLIDDPRGRAKRTAALVLDIIQDIDSDRSRAAAMAVRTAHRGVEASVADYRYVLGCLLTTPIQFVDAADRHGFSEVERTSAVGAYRKVATALGLGNFPESFDAAVRYVDDYEAESACWTAAGALMAQTTLEAYAGTGVKRRLTFWLVRNSYSTPIVGEHLGLGRSSSAGRRLALSIYRLVRSLRGEAL